MKIREITEGKTGKKPKHVAKADTGEWIWRDDGTDRTYNLNRVMMAAAMSNGQDQRPVDMDEASWVEKNNVARPYTEAEHNMMKSAFATVSSHYRHSNKDHRSREDDKTHRASPVPHNAGAAKKKRK